MANQKHEYWKPSVTADIVVADIHQAKYRANGCFVNILLIKRSDKSEAYPNCWALPGGFLDEGESIPECAIRELKEETGLDATLLAPIGVFSEPNRDPRGRVISNAFLTLVMSTDEQPLRVKAGDDAKDIDMFKLKGCFSKEDGSLSVSLHSPKNKITIEYKARFNRDKYGLLNTVVEYKSDTKMAFDHAGILAKAILRSPDLVMTTSDKSIYSGEEGQKKNQ